MKQRLGHKLGLVLIAVASWPVLSSGRAGADEPINPLVARGLEEWKQGATEGRLRALQRFEQRGSKAAPAVPLLISALRDPDANIRAQTAVVLSQIGEPGLGALPHLILLLKDPSAQVRSSGALAIGRFGVRAEAAIPALVESLRAAPDHRCVEAATALGRIGDAAVPALIDLLSLEDSNVRSGVAQAIHLHGRAPKSALSALIEALRTRDIDTRWVVVESLASVGPQAVGPLTDALRDGDPRVRGGAAAVLAILGERAEPAIPALIEALGNPIPPEDAYPPETPQVRGVPTSQKPAARGIYFTLASIGPSAISPLIEQLDRPDAPSRGRAIRAIGFIGADARPAVSRLVRLLGDGGVRMQCAEALGRIGPPARDAIAPLMKRATDPDPVFRAKVVEAIGLIDVPKQNGPQTGDGARPRRSSAAILAALRDTDPRVRVAAAHALRETAWSLPETSLRLVELFGDPAPEVRLQALGDLQGIELPPESQERILDVVQDTDPRVRKASIDNIKFEQLGSDQFLAAVLKSLTDSDVNVRAAACHKLSGAGAKTLRADELGHLAVVFESSLSLAKFAKAGDTLRSASGDADPTVRAAATTLLPIFKDETAASLPLVTARLRDPEPRVRRAAADALAGLGAAAKPATPQLADALADPDLSDTGEEVVSALAARALCVIDPEAKDTVARRLISALGDREETVRDRAFSGLDAIRADVFSPLCRALADPKQPRSVQIALLRLVATSFGQPQFPGQQAATKSDEEGCSIAPVLRSLTLDHDANVRANAYAVLAALDPEPDAVANLVLGAVRDGDVELPGDGGLFQVLLPVGIPMLLKGLREPDTDVRSQIVRACAELYRANEAQLVDPAVIEALLLGLSDPDAQVRLEVTHLLGSITQESPNETRWNLDAPQDPEAQELYALLQKLRVETAGALIPLLKDDHAAVRWTAAWGLGRTGDAGKPAIPALIDMMRSDHQIIGSDVMARLPEAGSQLEEIGYRIESGFQNEPSRVAAIVALGRFGPEAAQAVPDLIDALHSSDHRVRAHAAEAIALIGPAAKAAVPDLIEWLGTRDDPGNGWVVYPDAQGGWRILQSRVMPIVALGRIGPESRAAVPALILALRDGRAQVRREAIRSLGAIGPAASPAQGEIARIMTESKDDRLSLAAAEALGRIGMAALPTLQELFRHQDPDIRVRAATALGAVGPAAAAVVPELLVALKASEDDLRAAAAAALGKVSSVKSARVVIAAMIEAVKDESPLVRKAVAAALSKIGASDNRVIPALLNLLNDSDDEVSAAVPAALAGVGTQALPAILALWANSDDDIRQRVASVLMVFASDEPISEDETEDHAHRRSVDSLAYLLSALGARNERMRTGAGEVLQALGQQVLPHLVAGLDDPSPAVRLGVVKTLGAIGTEARLALGSLTRCRSDPDPEIRKAAYLAVKAIEELGP
jgi:HEAT repeat protein